MNLRKFFLYSLIVSVVVSALLGIGVVLFGDFGDIEVRVLMTTFTITCTSILGLACGAYLESGRGKVMPYAGIALSTGAAALCLFLIWQRGLYSDTVGKLSITFSLLATACALLSLVGLARFDARFRWSFYLNHMAVWTLSAILLSIIWLDLESNSSLVSRLIGVLSIVIAALTIMTPVFHKLSTRHEAEPEAEAESIDAEIERLKARIEELERSKSAAGLNGEHRKPFS
jgi:hypothetical protein